ncbi:MAG: ATP synthase subunit I [Peptococcaceae bacterium]|nr:ATP synthase subunit I [Peptococcaceae bacterium]
MNSRSVIILLGSFSAAIFIGISLTNQYTLLGILIGFTAGLVNIQWLFRDAKKALDQELYVALKIYYKSLFSRLGMITLVVATIGRFRPEWLFYLALGIAVGVIIPLILAIRQQLMRGRG